jgi:hypothetical protein
LTSLNARCYKIPGMKKDLIRVLLLDRRDITLGLGKQQAGGENGDALMGDLDDVLDECRKDFIPKTYHPIYKPDLFELYVVNTFNDALRIFKEKRFDFTVIYKKYEGDTLITSLLKELDVQSASWPELPFHVMPFPSTATTFERLTNIHKVSEAATSLEGVAWTIWKHSLLSEGSKVVISIEQEGRAIASLVEKIFKNRPQFGLSRGIIYEPPHFYDTADFAAQTKSAQASTVTDKMLGILKKKII